MSRLSAKDAEWQVFVYSQLKQNHEMALKHQNGRVNTETALQSNSAIVKGA